LAPPIKNHEHLKLRMGEVPLNKYDAFSWKCSWVNINRYVGMPSGAVYNNTSRNAPRCCFSRHKYCGWPPTVQRHLVPLCASLQALLTHLALFTPTSVLLKMAQMFQIKTPSIRGNWIKSLSLNKKTFAHIVEHN